MKYLLSLFKLSKKKSGFFYGWEQAQFERKLEAVRENARPAAMTHWNRIA